MNSLAATPPVLRWILVVTAAIWVVVELRQSITHRPEGVRANWGSEVLFRLIVGVGAVAAGVLPGVAPSATIRPAPVADWIGLVLFWSGISLRLWSFHTLGRYFTFTVQTSSDQPVITDGPYRLIRHPSYAGLLLVIMAVGLFIGNWFSLVCLTVAIAGGPIDPEDRLNIPSRCAPSLPKNDIRTHWRQPSSPAASIQVLPPGSQRGVVVFDHYTPAEVHVRYDPRTHGSSMRRFATAGRRCQ